MPKGATKTASHARSAHAPSPARVRRRSRWHPDIEGALADLAAKGPPGYSAAVIYGELQEQFKGSTMPIPDERTISNRLRDLRPRDPSAPWTVRDDASSADAALIMPVLATVIAETRGQKRQLTRTEAAWLVRVRRARPDLLPWWAYRFARAYVAAELQGDNDALGALDEQLALAPVQAPFDAAAIQAATQARYRDGLKEGWVRPATFALWPETWPQVEQIEGMSFDAGTGRLHAKTPEAMVEVAKAYAEAGFGTITEGAPEKRTGGKR